MRIMMACGQAPSNWSATLAALKAPFELPDRWISNQGHVGNQASHVEPCTNGCWEPLGRFDPCWDTLKGSTGLWLTGTGLRFDSGDPPALRFGPWNSIIEPIGYARIM
jgi:hypothetical protein